MTSPVKSCSFGTSLIPTTVCDEDDKDVGLPIRCTDDDEDILRWEALLAAAQPLNLSTRLTELTQTDCWGKPLEAEQTTGIMNQCAPMN